MQNSSFPNDCLDYFFRTLIPEGIRKLAGLGFAGAGVVVSSRAGGASAVEGLESESESCFFFLDGAGAPRGGNSSSEMTAAAAGAAPLLLGAGCCRLAMGTLGSCCAIIGMVARGIPGWTTGGMG